MAQFSVTGQTNENVVVVVAVDFSILQSGSVIMTVEIVVSANKTVIIRPPPQTKYHAKTEQFSQWQK